MEANEFFPDVLVDPRIGSRDLVEPLLRLKIPARLEHLEYGDVQMVRRGPDDRPVLVGIEVKTVNDVLACIVDKRFSGHQLPGLLASYEVRWLLIEGAMVCAPTRELLIARLDGKPPKRAAVGERPWVYEAVQSWRRSVEMSGCYTDNVPDRRSTVAWIASYYAWSRKRPEEHQSQLGIRLKNLGVEQDPIDPLASYLVEVTPKMKVAASLLRGIGVERARAAAAYFRSIKSMVGAPASEWEKVEGFGKKLSTAVVTAIEEGE